jgi:hypothetical protein
VAAADVVAVVAAAVVAHRAVAAPHAALVHAAARRAALPRERHRCRGPRLRMFDDRVAAPAIELPVVLRWAICQHRAAAVLGVGRAVVILLATDRTLAIDREQATSLDRGQAPAILDHDPAQATSDRDLGLETLLVHDQAWAAVHRRAI